MFTSLRSFPARSWLHTDRRTIVQTKVMTFGREKSHIRTVYVLKFKQWIEEKKTERGITWGIAPATIVGTQSVLYPSAVNPFGTFNSSSSFLSASVKTLPASSFFTLLTLVPDLSKKKFFVLLPNIFTL